MPDLDPMPTEPAGGAEPRPDDGPQTPDLDDLDGQAEQVDNEIEGDE
jgi:hypothetical protein